jgi:hypothetical protein
MDTNGLCPIIVSFDLLIIPLSFSFEGHFKSTYPFISLEYWPLEAMKPSLLAFEPSLTPNWAMMWINIENVFNDVSRTTNFRVLCDAKGL